MNADGQVFSESIKTAFGIDDPKYRVRKSPKRKKAPSSVAVLSYLGILLRPLSDNNTDKEKRKKQHKTIIYII